MDTMEVLRDTVELLKDAPEEFQIAATKAVMDVVWDYTELQARQSGSMDWSEFVDVAREIARKTTH